MKIHIEIKICNLKNKKMNKKGNIIINWAKQE